MEQTVSIGMRLREERQRLGMSQPVFGEVGGVTKKTQMLYESGERMPDAEYLAAITLAGVDVLYVLTGDRSFMPPPPISPEHRVLIRDYEASSADGQEAIRRMAAATALGASASAASGKSPKRASQVFTGEVGQAVKGNIKNTGPITFNVGKKER